MLVHQHLHHIDYNSTQNNACVCQHLKVAVWTLMHKKHQLSLAFNWLSVNASNFKSLFRDNLTCRYNL